jgi:predicted molibdopterin-dependent oxidoreductase YjgC
VDPSVEEGSDIEAMLGNVRGLVVVRDNATESTAFPGRAIQALRRLDSLIVLDAYRSTTSDAATVALPLADLVETDGTLTSAEGRVQRLRAAVNPPGMGRPGWEVLATLLEGLGLPCTYHSFGDVFREIGAVIPEYGPTSDGDLEEPWGGQVSLSLVSGDLHPSARGAGEAGRAPDPPGTHWLALEGAFDWEDDLLVAGSPTLRRDGAARRKLYPGGFVTMNPADAKALGIRGGWSILLRSNHGEAVVPVVLDSRSPNGRLLAPFTVRGALTPVLGEEPATRVEVIRT